MILPVGSNYPLIVRIRSIVGNTNVPRTGHNMNTTEKQTVKVQTILSQVPNL